MAVYRIASPLISTLNLSDEGREALKGLADKSTVILDAMWTMGFTTQHVSQGTVKGVITDFFYMHKPQITEEDKASLAELGVKF